MRKSDVLKTSIFQFKMFVSRLVFGEFQLMQISLNFQTSGNNLKVRGLGAKVCVAFLLFLFWKELWRFKVKESMLFGEQNIDFNKNETKLKMKKSHTHF